MKSAENQVENGSDIVKVNPIKKWLYRIAPAFGIALLLAVWITASGRNVRIFPTPWIVLQRMWELLFQPVSGATLLGHLGISMLRVFIALGFAIVIGVPFGVLIGWSPRFRATLGAIFECIRPIPVLAWIPLITICFGVSELSKVLIVFIGAVMAVVINTRAGLQTVDPLYLDVGVAFNANKRQMLMEIAIPAAMPVIFAGVRTSTSVAWTVVLAAEMIGSSSGVGFLVVRGMNGDDLALVLVAMITIGVIGALLAVVTSFIERLVCPWMVKK